MSAPNWTKELYSDDMPQRALELMTEGESFLGVAVELGVHTSTLYEWIDEGSPQFKGSALSDSIKKGKEASERYWADMGRKGALGKIKGFNVVAWIFSMKNRHNWQDKKELDIRQTHTLIDQTDEQLEGKARKLLGMTAMNDITLKPSDYKELDKITNN